MVNKELLQTIKSKTEGLGTIKNVEITRARGVSIPPVVEGNIQREIPNEAFFGPWREMHPQEEFYVDPNHISNASETRTIPVRIYGRKPQIEI